MRNLRIRNARIWDGDRLFHGNILVENGIIAAINDADTSVSEYDAGFDYDAKGSLVTPGLVDIHTHMRGISGDQYGIQAEMSCIPFGVTAAADASGEKGGKALLDTFLLKAVAFVPVEFKENHADFTRTEAMLAAFAEKAIGIKVYFDTAMSQVRDITPLEEVCEYAHARDLIVMVHSSNSPVPMCEVLNTLGKGDIFSHAYHGGMHTVAADAFQSLKQAKERGVIIDAGMAGYVHTDFGVLKAAIENDALPQVISTDITNASAYIRGGIYGMTTCMSMLRELGMPEEAILRAVTADAARAVKQEAVWGRLEVGRAADIAVFKYTDNGFDMTDRAGNRIKSDKGYRCILTAVDGQIMYRTKL